MKRAPQRGALFVLRYPLLLCVFALCSSAVRGAECAADRIDEEARVAYVYDGDTVRLEDGRKIRLAGINAPEVAKQDVVAEPMADEARAYLERLIAGERTVRLRFEQERHDRYGRLLAHLFLKSGSNMEERLLGEGLAQQLVVPPNTWQSDCYQRVEQRARRQQRGIWRLDYYQPLKREPPRSSDGRFRSIGGTVVRVAESRKSLWLNLDTGMAVRIARSDLRYFADVELHGLQGLQGQPIVVRGWLKRDGQRLQITLRHPSALMKAADWN